MNYLNTVNAPAIVPVNSNSSGTNIMVEALNRSARLTNDQKEALVSELANKLTEDVEGFDAARKSAEAAGDIAWRGYCWSGYLKLIYKHAMLGAEALLSGERGNDYSNYLLKEYPQLSNLAV